MFVSREKAITKKLFQKPNILRKNPKPVSNAKLTEATQLQIIVPASISQECTVPENNCSAKSTNYKCNKLNHKITPNQWIFIDDYVCDGYKSHTSGQFYEESNQNTLLLNEAHGEKLSKVNYHKKVNQFSDDNAHGPLVKIDNATEQKVEANNIYLTMMRSPLGQTELGCINFEDSNKGGIDPYVDNQNDVIIDCVEERKDALDDYATLSKNTIDVSETFNHQIVRGATGVEQSCLISNYAANFKCDVDECNKLFTTEEKLKKHKSGHNKQGSQRPSRQAVECPVKSLGINKDEACGKVYLNREELVKHLNENHTIEQASHRCEVCERRFFWLSGLRAQGRSHVSGDARRHACPWPGCGRVFLQACRLKEHTRAHTGDRPYACHYPECRWSFRTASKLMRHVRQHTGERRHECGECGRAFLRAEHLREHATRHAHPHHRPRHACTAHGCEQTFTNMSTLYFHMKKVHKKNGKKKLDNTTSAPVFSSHNEQDWTMVHNTFTLSNEEELSGPEWHAARTHCTWPLVPPRSPHPSPTPTSPGERPLDGDTEVHNEPYVLKSDDVQVEMFENSDSNVYTVRSDLFLHANAIHSEDSEGGDGAGQGGLELVVLPPPALDLDPPPSHLMQEELMYADAVDESSFQVFLLNGEEIN